MGLNIFLRGQPSFVVFDGRQYENFEGDISGLVKHHEPMLVFNEVPGKWHSPTIIIPAGGADRNLYHTQFEAFTTANIITKNSKPQAQLLMALL